MSTQRRPLALNTWLPISEGMLFCLFLIGVGCSFANAQETERLATGFWKADEYLETFLGKTDTASHEMQIVQGRGGYVVRLQTSAPRDIVFHPAPLERGRIIAESTIQSRRNATLDLTYYPEDCELRGEIKYVEDALAKVFIARPVAGKAVCDTGPTEAEKQAERAANNEKAAIFFKDLADQRSEELEYLQEKLDEAVAEIEALRATNLSLREAAEQSVDRDKEIARLKRESEKQKAIIADLNRQKRIGLNRAQQVTRLKRQLAESQQCQAEKHDLDSLKKTIADLEAQLAEADFDNRAFEAEAIKRRGQLETCRAQQREAPQPNCQPDVEAALDANKEKLDQCNAAVRKLLKQKAN